MLPPPPPPAPRAVPASVITWNARFGLLFGGIWGTLGTALPLAFLLFGGPPWYDLVLDRRGVRTDARPYALERTSTRINRKTVVRVRFELTDARGRTHRASATTTDGPLLFAAGQHQPVPVEYDPEDPTLVRFVGGSAVTFPLWAYFPALFGVAGALLFAASARSMRRTRRLYRSGVAAGAQVFAVESTYSRQNRRTVKRMRYRFQTDRGTFQGSWMTVSPAPVGAAIWVFHDAARPERNLPAAGWPTSVGAPRTPSPGQGSPPGAKVWV